MVFKMGMVKYFFIYERITEKNVKYLKRKFEGNFPFSDLCSTSSTCFIETLCKWLIKNG